MTDTDVFDLALTAPGGIPLLVERSDGHTSTTDLDWWLRREGAQPPGDLAALDWATAPGTALDIGCCTGRHLHHLAERGITATGIDTSPAAVRIAQAAGLDACLADAHHFTPTAPVDTVVALGGGLGIAGTRAAADAFLARLAGWLTPNGQIIVSSVDWTATADQHRTWVDAAHANGRYPGDVRVRLRHGDRTGEWFDWTWLDPTSLTAAADTAGLHIAELRRLGPAWYAAQLTRTGTVR